MEARRGEGDEHSEARPNNGKGKESVGKNKRSVALAGVIPSEMQVYGKVEVQREAPAGEVEGKVEVETVVEAEVEFEDKAEYESEKREELKNRGI